jgi:hypothetical protein
MLQTFECVPHRDALSADAAALPIGPDVGEHHVCGPFERIRIFARHEHDVSVIGSAHRLTLVRGKPRQQGLGAHVVIDQGAPQPISSVVGQRPVQQVAVE